MKNIPLYLLTIAMLALAMRLQSSTIAISIVALWSVSAAEAVFTRKNRDSDITEMMATLASHKAQMSILTRDITNVAERARNILGENF